MKAFLIILSATWKFAATFPIAIFVFEMTFIETLVYTNIGGLIGIIASLYFSKALLYLWNNLFPKKSKSQKRTKKTFTKFNRRLVLLKTKYGMPGIAVLTPVVLSIPLGTFLTAKYYHHKRNSYMFLVIGQFVWSLIYTIALTQFDIKI